MASPLRHGSEILRMDKLKESFNIKENDFIHAGEAAIRIKNLLKSLNTDPGLLRRVAICVYESEMNVVMHGGGGHLDFEMDGNQVILITSDSGIGIEDIETAMREGFSTAKEEHREMGFGAGMGLPNIKKNADHLEIQSEKGKGTIVRMVFDILKE